MSNAPKNVVTLGQELDFKILRIEHEDRKIALSARAVGKEEDERGGADSKMYSSEAKGGMTSLGELMNLKRGGAASEETPKDEQPKPNKKERKAQRALERSAQAEEDEDEDLTLSNSFEADSTDADSTDAEESETAVETTAPESNERAEEAVAVEVSQVEDQTDDSTGEAQTAETEEKSANN